MRMRQQRAKKTPLIELLQKTTYHDVYGELTDYGVRPSATIKEFVDRKRAGWWLRRLSNYKFERHFGGNDVFYFFGNPSVLAPYTLAVIDVDVQKKQGKGTPEGGIAFAEHLRRTYWPGLCWEKSRSGKGLGCPVFVKKEGRSAKEVNAMLKRLDRFLKAEARKVGADIENVEVKGTLPIISYRDRQPRAIQYGQFARYPRTLTFNQLCNSPVLSCEEWLLKDVPEPARAKASSALMVGSVSGYLIGEDELAQLPRYERLYRHLVGTDLKATARFTVTAHDFAISCVLLRFFKMNPNKDGTMPTGRIKALWNALHEAGQVKRPFNDRRWKRIRDWLSENGHIDWQDERYQAPNPAHGLRPIACKWSITDEFFDVLESLKLHEREASFFDTVEVKRGPGRRLEPRLCVIQRQLEQVFWSDADSRLEMLMAA